MIKDIGPLYNKCCCLESLEFGACPSRLSTFAFVRLESLTYEWGPLWPVVVSAGGRPKIIRGRLAKSCGDRIILNVFDDAQYFFFVSSPVVVRFILPERSASRVLLGVDLAGRETFQTLRDLAQFFVGFEEHMHVIHHDAPAVEIITFGRPKEDGVLHGLCRGWVFQMGWTICSRIQFPIRHGEEEFARAEVLVTGRFVDLRRLLLQSGTLPSEYFDHSPWYRSLETPCQEDDRPSGNLMR